MAMPNEPQSMANHARYVPGYHFVLFGMLVLNLLFSIYHLRHFSGTALFGLVVAVSLILVAWYERVFALSVQDRVIRLEERLRIEKLCPDLAGRAAGLDVKQIVALRFASDEELPALLRKVLDEDIRSQKAIKGQIRNWRADHVRA
jgi:Family of unknown function (DUF6526)